jgi:hypothetical protein
VVVSVQSARMNIFHLVNVTADAEATREEAEVRRQERGEVVEGGLLGAEFLILGPGTGITTGSGF